MLKDVDRETRTDTLVESRTEGKAIVANCDGDRVYTKKGEKLRYVC